ncbi:DNA (cytosine-5-)-methyltransferase [Thalassospira sp. FZY0004]|uniref:Cytosine-specific methyltransferase n=1 Tax=Thalassospira aquimaris TaxID=3037796 RepID=A0ABT6GI98_9PROT|nr:DNA (cytosine-5-)-methyltransferase [Thalassospira sp. FZY0004]MDG4721740.1 DNA (cytosine-5-)-methyltransferase [Thalassospira sp. FZY0004]
MKYLSVCSGIEAATVAWHPLGWVPAAFSEIDDFPRAVLKHHYPDVPLHGRDRLKGETIEEYAEIAGFQTIGEDDYGSIDLLVGGTPCQSFSVAGLRKGLDDDRGNLALEFLRLAQRKRPQWVLWENVPGVLSSNKGRDFGSILGGLAELGYGFSYRILDAQYVRVDGLERAVPQRRRRVFVVGYLGDWRPAAAVLFEYESLSGNPAPRREAGQRPAPTISARTKAGGGLGTDFDLDGGLIHAPTISPALKARDFKGPSSDGDGDGAPLVTHSLRGEGFDASEDGTGRGTPIVPVHLRAESADGDFKCPACGEENAVTWYPTCEWCGWEDVRSREAIAFDCKASGRNGFAVGDISPTLRAMASKTSHQNAGGQVAAAYPIQEVGKRTGKSTTDKRAGIGIGNEDDPMMTLQAGAQHGVAYSIMPMNSNTDYKARETDVSQPLMAGGPVGGNQGGDYIANTMAVRRLMPVECERLQGFPEIIDRVRIEVWHSSDLRQIDALAATSSHKSQKHASIADASASMPHANSVAEGSCISRRGHALPVALDVLVNLERGEVLISRAERLILSVSTAEKQSASHLSMPTDDFVRLAALMTQIAVPQTLSGRVESPALTSGSSLAWIGNALVSVSGQEIEELASDAVMFTTALNDSTKFTTSPFGPNTQSLGSMQRTLSCCVTAAISSCIQSEIRAVSSYAVSVEVVRGYTAIPWRGKDPEDCPDGPRYKGLGNSMSVNCMRWIGKRIDAVTAIIKEQAA